MMSFALTLPFLLVTGTMMSRTNLLMRDGNSGSDPYRTPRLSSFNEKSNLLCKTSTPQRLTMLSSDVRAGASRLATTYRESFVASPGLSGLAGSEILVAFAAASIPFHP